MAFPISFKGNRMINIQQCESIDEVRSNIDRIDTLLVGLIAERSQYVKQAAKFKKNTTEVKAASRVEQIIKKVIAQANELHAPSSVVEAVYRTMINEFIHAELSEHETINREHT